ncbi:DUF2291 family protein [Aliifodinibius sp. S!AR15-10]|uniref:DUF2291 family protein n=1 Tax=Aliifodinibius sp. S!AR15-10 TaxID=2950437 RepID=UPI0028611E44|nr:DUF2291 family protein [Aliifodinibius sp. S!AR15-10]MDR8389815.1 DUF2291 family protein [Aliifodinibius sp. S!AR15-10]
MNRFVKYGILGIAVVIILVNSINIRNLEEVRSEANEGDFDAATYAQNFWEQQRSSSLEQAVNIERLLDSLEQNFDSTAARGEQVGISDYRYFLVRGQGTIQEMLEDDVLVSLDGSNNVRLATGFIFGNTIRNAVPQIDIGEFVNMTQFNQVSIQINELVEEQVVPTLTEQAGIGENVSFAGALSINVESRELDSLRIIPLRIDMED